MLDRVDARTEVLSVAKADYNPALVALDDSVISQVSFPRGELTLMRSDVLGKAAGVSLQLAIQYLLILNSLNFRFWDLKDGEFVRYAYQGQIGAMGMRKAFAAAWGDEPGPYRFFKTLRQDGVEAIFGEIPAGAERAVILDELHQSVHTGNLGNLIERLVRAVQSRHVFTMNDARLVAETLPLSYGDGYLKKAQLALTEIAGFCHEVFAPVDCGDFTLFADYQLPRVMRAMGVLRYSAPMAQLVDQQRLIPAGSAEERALRGATILAGESLTKQLGCTAAELDHFLWTNRNAAGKAPFHLTPTTAY